MDIQYGYDADVITGGAGSAGERGPAVGGTVTVGAGLFCVGRIVGGAAH